MFHCRYLRGERHPMGICRLGGPEHCWILMVRCQYHEEYYYGNPARKLTVSLREDIVLRTPAAGSLDGIEVWAQHVQVNVD